MRSAIEFMLPADLEKAESGASGACGHFDGNHALLGTFWVKYPLLFSEDGGRRVEDQELRLAKGKIEVC